MLLETVFQVWPCPVEPPISLNKACVGRHLSDFLDICRAVWTSLVLRQHLCPFDYEWGVVFCKWLVPSLACS